MGFFHPVSWRLPGGCVILLGNRLKTSLLLRNVPPDPSRSVRADRQAEWEQDRVTDGTGLLGTRTNLGLVIPWHRFGLVSPWKQCVLGSIPVSLELDLMCSVLGKMNSGSCQKDGSDP